MNTTTIQPQVWAHRGWSAAYPENTLPAFGAALALGVDGIELDVHLTRDHEIIVVHDARLERTTDGTGNIAEYTLDELKQLDAGWWFHPSFGGTGMPTLTEVLSLVRNHNTAIALNIEIKVGEAVYPDLETMVWRQVLDFGLEQQTLVSSFHHGLLAGLKRQFPAAPIGLLLPGELPAWPGRYAKERDAAALHPHHPVVDKETVARCHADNVAVHVWTVNDFVDMQRLVNTGVDAIITNHPDVLMAILHAPGVPSQTL